MINKPQHPFTRHVPVALIGAALTIGCGRSEVQPVDPHNDVAVSITQSQLGPEAFVRIVNLPQYRLDNWQQIRGTLPPLNAVAHAIEAPRGELLRWTRNVLFVQQLEGMPMIYHDSTDPQNVQRYMVYFDRGMIYVSAVWEAHDQAWAPVQPESIDVPSLDRADPLTLWSDMYGALEMRDCRRNQAGRFDCDISHEAEVNAYFPRTLQKGVGPQDLACLNDCINPFGDSGSPYFDLQSDRESGSPSEVAVRYEYNANDQMLTYEGAEVVSEGSQNLYAVSGFMFDAEDKYLSDMACTFEGEQPVGTCSYHELDVFYTWSTDVTIPVFGRRAVR